ncbi:MAG: RICIN domain-containing protein, partial [Oscillospiraceae bacterium]|nr:RICIN domain-containing protein [Oscillospiraceae bacterium]
AIVTEISGGRMLCAEQNYAYKQYVTSNWHNIDAQTYIHPNFTDSNPVPDFTPADIGTDFYASIENTKAIKPIITYGNNVVLGEMSGENNQIWKFERQSDISYKIINVATGTCLDDENYGTVNGNNIQVCVSNDTNAQRWYLKVVGNGYSLVPQCALNSCIDVQDGVLSSGKNIQLFQQNNSDAQIFTISPRPSFNAVNKGDSFTAAIIFNATGSAVTAFDDNNVGVMSYTGTANQLWNFERKSNRSYKITNVATGKCLDDENFGTADKTNIQVCQSNDTTAQRWFLKAVEDGFSLAPQCALYSCIDSYNGGTNDGMNIYLWTQNSTPAQIVSLKYVLTPDYETTYNGHSYKLYNKALPWREAYKFCEQQGGHLVTVNSENEQSFLYDLINKKSTGSYLWLGATDSYEEGKWKWITGESIFYQNWADKEPNNYDDEDYMSMYINSGKWNDGNDIYYTDTKAYSFICEIDNDIVE